MSLHKLTAGSGYDYLTRQVAAMDATDKAHTGLASYYTEKGETPGVWMGSGMAGIDGLSAGDAVTADHMQNLFGAGHHPLATQRTKELDLRIGRPGLTRPTEADYQEAARLGAPHKVFAGDVSAFRIEVAQRFAEWNATAGHPGDYPVPASERAKIRTEVAREFFRAEHGREPSQGSEGARELAATIAKHSRTKTNAVAGYDLTFSPVKSVSTLWAIADPTTAALIERAHQAAIKDALDFLETHALFTRQGANGVRQVDVRGLVATAFTHRDSRAGDPDLHTHVAVANKVQTLSPDGTPHGTAGGAGKWLAIDGRPLHKAIVSASETYNTALERHLIDALGVRFAERPDTDTRKRPVREIVGVDPQLNVRFSKRRADVEDRRKVLVAAFQATHGRPPTPIETLQLAQQATLETREAKHEPRSLAEQRDTWHREAVEVLGTPERVLQMVHHALNPGLTTTLSPRAAGTSPADPKVDAAWVGATADRIVATMEGGRSTWQYWHVYAEAQRHVRAADVATHQVVDVVDLLVSEVLHGRSVALTRPTDETAGIHEPVELRRADGTSVYSTAGSALFTSSTILAAEERLVAAAGRHDGYAAEASSVDLALLESAANGITLNAGQATLVREMATSGARLQLAIAPAGSGKTTAMRALASAWTDSGGTIIGLAPSAAAADALRSHIGTQTETLAKLTHSIERARLSEAGPGDEAQDWVAGIDSSTLVVIDEAGMADTVSLDVAVSYVLEHGGSVRLVGDDQQLAAIGAGGVLRDIRATHGALQLTELVRFADPAEASASLALREGRSESIGFYLDRDRVHVGDLDTMTEDVFDAWRSDRAAGLDSIMLAPTRDLVAELNRQARTHRLAETASADPADAGLVRRLTDGNDASSGDLIITRTNDRRLRTSATDWVKNGDRWHLLEIHDSGDLTVQHTQHGRTVRLPRDYVETATELGYACTVHTAQGVTADTMHGLAIGSESRQHLYTMMTRGAVANHVYLEVVGDGDPHSVIHPTLVRPLTPTDILEQVLARDDTQRSATSLLRDQADPATRLGDAAQHYLDSLYVAAEMAVGVDVVETLDTTADKIVPGLTDQPAWPSLRSQLLFVGAQGGDPTATLRSTVESRELDNATDTAAVLDWRLDSSGHRSTSNAAIPAPLPWMPGIPHRLAEDPHWGAYLSARAHLVEHLADQVRVRATEQATGRVALPAWAQNGVSRHRKNPDTVADILAEVSVWRAAMQVSADDRRPTGAPQLQKAAATYQRRLNRAVTGDHSPALIEWRHLLHSVAPQVPGDDFTPQLAERLAAMSRAGIPARQLLHTASTAGGPLPDEHSAAALWWRMARHLTPAVAAQFGDGAHGEVVRTAWSTQLPDLLGTERASHIQASSWWPALVANVDHGLQRGWQLEDLLGTHRPPPSDAQAGVDECQTLVWRTSIALDPIPDENGHDEYTEEPPPDLWDGVEIDPADVFHLPHVDLSHDAVGTLTEDPRHVPDHQYDSMVDPVDLVTISASTNADSVNRVENEDEARVVEGDLRLAGYVRDSGPTTLEPTDADIGLMYQRAEEWYSCPVSRERMIEINEMAQTFFETQFGKSWGRDYLAERFGLDLAGHENFHPGQAPPGWTHLVTHLRRIGVTDTEMLAAGVASTSSKGNLIDRFRDRVMFPVVHQTQILGFVGRRHPDHDHDHRTPGGAGPKYLNTATTPLFHKSAQLFGVVDELLNPTIGPGAVPVIVEGPMDAIAVTLASAGRYLGVAPLGTSLSDEQATQIATLTRHAGHGPIVATDSDLAGHIAAERDFWMLTPHGLDPGYVRFPDGLDPADLLTQRGPAALTAALTGSTPLGELILSERLADLDPEPAGVAAMRVLAARPSHAWHSGAEQIRDRLQLTHPQARRDLRDAVKLWDAAPRTIAQDEMQSTTETRRRLEASAAKSPVERWAPLAQHLDSRLPEQSDWPATAAMLQQAHEDGHDINTVTRALIAEAPLNLRPAADLRYRIVSYLQIGGDTRETPLPRTSPSTGIAREQRETPVRRPPQRGSPQR